jgi:hypothetical protein
MIKLSKGVKIGCLLDDFVTTVNRWSEPIIWEKGEVVEYIKKNGTCLVYCSKLDATVAPRFHHLITREEYIEEMTIKWDKLK